MKAVTTKYWPVAFFLAAAAGFAIAGTFGEAFEVGDPIVPEDGYEWSDQQRAYWPTEGWLVGAAAEYGFDDTRLSAAFESASQDELMRAILIVRDGRLVVEEYFNGGAPDQST